MNIFRLIYELWSYGKVNEPKISKSEYYNPLSKSGWEPINRKEENRED